MLVIGLPDSSDPRVKLGHPLIPLAWHERGMRIPYFTFIAELSESIWGPFSFAYAINVMCPWPRFCTAFGEYGPDPVEVQLVPPLSSTAWTIVERWLAAPNCWIPEATGWPHDLGNRSTAGHPRHLVSDAQLAALAIEHGVPVVSVDSDFARFGEINWINPLAR